MFLLCVTDIFSKYAWVILLKDKKAIAITNAFLNFLKESNRKPNKIWVDKSSEFYNRSMKSFLQNNNIELYLTYNEGKFVVAERFIWTLKDKIYKYRTTISKNVYIGQLDEIVNHYNNIYHGTIKIKQENLNPRMYIDLNKEYNNEDSKLKVGDNFRVLK